MADTTTDGAAASSTSDHQGAQRNRSTIRSASVRGRSARSLGRRPPRGGSKRGAGDGRSLGGPASATGGLSPQTVRVILAGLVVLVVAGALTGVLLRRSQPKVLRASNITVPVPGASSKPLPATAAEVMGLTPMKGRAAPGFTLTDQHGKTVSLAQLAAGHAVVLTFFDDRCIDVCPIVAQEIVSANAALGAAAARVDFVAVNVNPLHTSVAAVRQFGVEHGLAKLPNWYFLTGGVSSLERVWSDYKVTVQVSQKNKAVLHTNQMYFLSPGGKMLYQATPFADERPNGTGFLPAPTMAKWSHGIAKYARAALA